MSRMAASVSTGIARATVSEARMQPHVGELSRLVELPFGPGGGESGDGARSARPLGVDHQQQTPGQRVTEDEVAAFPWVTERLVGRKMTEVLLLQTAMRR